MAIEWDSHTLEVLEFPLIRLRWADLTETPIGREIALSRPLSWDLETAQARQEETSEASQLLSQEPPPSLVACQEVRPAITRALKGGILPPEELLALAQGLRTLRLLKEFLMPRMERYPRLASYAAQIQLFTGLERQIEATLSPAGEILDEASSDLAKIRHEQRRLQKKIVEELHRILNSSRWQEVLQEPIYTIRGGRYCVPVKSEYRGRVRGLVHDTSMSGATLFIEPEELVTLGNRLRELEGLEKEEVERILYGLSRGVEAVGEALLDSFRRLGELDAILAAGRLSHQLHAHAPLLNQEGVWHLRRARHPLLDPTTVVPIDLEVGRHFQALLITGPNTGGKTVTLKTVGLLTLMALAGLHLPAEEGSRVAIPTGVFADIGDEQSLQQSLSTFSGHIRHIARYLEMAAPHALVLLDEIGAGTDPTEGAALAKAILTAFVEKGARVIATTHYGELKAFAYEHPAFQNAAMEFDLETLRPTYRLRMGIPGASHAILIAARLGLDQKVIQNAETALGTQQIDLLNMLRKLEAAQRAAEEMREEFTHRLREVETLKSQLQAQLEEAEQARREARLVARQEVQTLLRQIRAEADTILQELRKASRESKRTQQLTHQLEQVMQQGQQQAEVMVSSLSPTPAAPLRKGQRVRVTGFAQVGVLLSDPKEGRATVQIGAIRATLPVQELQVVEEEKPTIRAGRTNVMQLRQSRARQVASELHLRMKQVDEALELLDRYLDDALLAGLEQVRIVHGKGTGTLRRVVRQRLQEHPEVDSFRDADPANGGTGVTIVTFKKH